MELRDRIDSQREYWDKKSSWYDSSFSYNSLAGKIKIQRKADWMIQEGQITSRSIVLELGCGTGTYTRKLARAAGYIIALDISEQMIKIAPKIENVEYRLKDVHELQEFNEYFDVITGAYILEYADLDILLPGLVRALKPGGRLAFIELNAMNPIAFALTRIGIIQRIFHKPKINNSFYWWQIKERFERYGLTDMKTEPMEFNDSRWFTNRTVNNWLEQIPVIQEFAGSLAIRGTKP